MGLGGITNGFISTQFGINSNDLAPSKAFSGNKAVTEIEIVSPTTEDVIKGVELMYSETEVMAREVEVGVVEEDVVELEVVEVVVVGGVVVVVVVVVVVGVVEEVVDEPR